MRLIQLKIRNIASLKGEHVINFSEIESHSSLFAITGETGAGKSTILNSIGLALYGQVYKKNVTQVDVVTLGEKEGQIELIFQVKGKNYLADWRAKVRKQNNEVLKQPQILRYLYELDGKNFDSNKQITTIEVSELLNLDFDQFCKCIILNQGEFARFLSSSFTERKEILEKLYPGEMLENLNRHLKTDLDFNQRLIEELDIELKTLRGDELDGNDLASEKEKLTLTLSEQEGFHAQFEKLEFHFSSLISYHTKFGENKSKSESLRKEMAFHTTRYNLLLKESQEITEKYQEAQRRQERELPRLQEFLKLEENLRHLQEQSLGQQKSLSEILKTIDELETKNLELELKLRELDIKKQTTQSEFKLSVEGLQKVQHHFNDLFDFYSLKEIKAQELQNKKEKLLELEEQGKELSLKIKDIELQKTAIPGDLPLLVKEVETQKKLLQTDHEKKQRALILIDENEKQIAALSKEEKDLVQRKDTIAESIHHATLRKAPLETTLKLQDLIAAVDTCLNHTQYEDTEQCPVCHGHVARATWEELRSGLKKNDINAIRQELEDLTRLIMKDEEEAKHLTRRIELLKQGIKTKLEEQKPLLEAINKSLPSLEELDEKLSRLNKDVWGLQILEKDLQKHQSDLSKARENYSHQRADIAGLSKAFDLIIQKFNDTTSHFNEFKFSEFGQNEIALLKKEGRLLQSYQELNSQTEKLSQEKKFLEKTKSDGLQQITLIEQALKDNDQKIKTSQQTLMKELGGSKAQDLMLEITREHKILSDQWAKMEQDLKKQELLLKEFQSKLYNIDELSKEIELHFSKELFTVKDTATEIRLEETGDRERLVRALAQLSVDFTTPSEIFLPLKERLTAERNSFKELINMLRMSLAGVTTRLIDWTKRQEKITALEQKRQEIRQVFIRLERLFEVLGKDELRTFVLSLVEENLIAQTNDELQKLCQGRYEIVHQSRRMKMTPEFYILDKFREGGLRKVSTLSGGETFMVSLAMAIALAEMTRGQAEIDSLFIDEGFGTLDQDSLEDVLDMLQQIQTRGLMVGIISHIKSLTNALPVNLVLSKKQDGVSTLSIQLN